MNQEAVGKLAKIVMAISVDPENQRALAEYALTRSRSLSAVANECFSAWRKTLQDRPPAVTKASNA